MSKTKEASGMTPRNLRDRLRRYSQKTNLLFFAPGHRDNPHPGKWVVGDTPRDLHEMAQWAVENSLINGDDRNSLRSELEVGTQEVAQDQGVGLQSAPVAISRTAKKDHLEGLLRDTLSSLSKKKVTIIIISD